MPDVFLGRQPIYTRQLDTFGYELLFRSGDANEASFLDGDQATARVISNTFLEIGLEQVTSGHLAFINVTRNILVSGYCSSLPRDRIVLEVLENVSADPDVVEALADLSERGYTIALDDFVYRDDLRPLLSLADIVKLDVLALKQVGLREHRDLLRPYDLMLLGEKIDTYEDFEFCKELGFEYFQGYFFCKPRILHGKKIKLNRLSTLRLLAKLQEPDIGLDELEAAIGTDVGLSHKLLRYINSAVCGLVRRVGSLREAVVYMGTQRIKTWAGLLLLAGIDDKPPELMKMALIRGKMCELLAHAQGKEEVEKSRYFTVGLLSVLDAMLDTPMEEALDVLPFSEEVNHALLYREGTLGNVLNCAIEYDRCDWDKVSCADLDAETIRTCYVDSIHWASEVALELGMA